MHNKSQPNDKFKLCYVSSVSEDFKHFSENTTDLHNTSQTNRREFLQQKERLKKLEDKYKEFRIEVFKDTVSVFENIVHQKKINFDKKYTDMDSVE